MTSCVICKFPVADGELACSERCLTEFNNRREIAKARIRALQAIKKERRRTTEDIVSSILRAASGALLDKDIPTYTSCRDLDKWICERDPSLKKITPNYRKRQITTNVPMIYYRLHSRAGKGRVTFILTEDKEVVRSQLKRIVSQGMTV
jgi:hypothetical protein